MWALGVGMMNWHPALELLPSPNENFNHITWRRTGKVCVHNLFLRGKKKWKGQEDLRILSRHRQQQRPKPCCLEVPRKDVLFSKTLSLCLFGLISPYLVQAYQFLEANPVGLLPDIKSHAFSPSVLTRIWCNINIHLRSPCQKCSE